MKKIVVTGGLGFIGSHTVVELQNAGFEVVIIDNLSNAQESVLEHITKITGKKPLFEKFDLRDKADVQDFFRRHTDVEGLIHFAASKAVGESVEKPLLYYNNNLTSLIYLLEELSKLKKAHFIFSSSCTVYGQADKLPITEDAPVKKAESPYGNTKQISEEIISDTCRVTPQLNAIALRYFNPIGAHPSAEIGELPLGVPQNLVPYITQTAIGLREKLSVFAPKGDIWVGYQFVEVRGKDDAEIYFNATSDKCYIRFADNKVEEVNLGAGMPFTIKGYDYEVISK